MPITRAYGQASQLGNTPAASNPFINGGMDIWQRGTSFALSASTSTYTADRWKCRRNNTGCTISRQATNDTTNVPFIQYCLRAQRDSGNTATDLIQVTQSFENVNSIPFAGKTLTLSFYARAGANYSSSSNGLSVSCRSGTITDGDIIVNTFGNNIAVQTVTLTTTWQRFTITGSMVASDTAIGIQFFYTPSGTAGANDYFEVTGVQLDVGPIALPFRRSGGTIAGELAACQRYYFRTQTGSDSSAFVTTYGAPDATTQLRTVLVPPVSLRVNPTSVDYGSLRAYDGSGYITITSLALGGSTRNNVHLVATAASGFTVYRPTVIALNGDSQYIGINAEL